MESYASVKEPLAVFDGAARPEAAGKGWGKVILKSLPPVRKTCSLAEVARFFAEDPREGR